MKSTQQAMVTDEELRGLPRMPLVDLAEHLGVNLGEYRDLLALDPVPADLSQRFGERVARRELER
jgi:hypothetical protein